MAKQPPLQLDIEQKGVEDSARLLYGMAKQGADPRPAFRQILDELRLAEDPWFRSRGQGTWPQLADVTKDDKMRLGYPSDPLVRTGYMGASLTMRSGRGTVRVATQNQMRFGTRVFYANFHRYGTGHMPER